MHRTQILLEDDQYRTVSCLARDNGESMGQCIRRLLDVSLRSATRKQGKVSIRELSGTVSDPEIAGKAHDRVLYGGGRVL